jgi:CRISPR-associated protein Cas2
MVYLICYDVVDDRRRLKISKLLKPFGLRVQKSVFECKLESRQFLVLQQKILVSLNTMEDQVRFYPLSQHCRGKVEILGLQPGVKVDDKAYIV